MKLHCNSPVGIRIIVASLFALMVLGSDSNANVFTLQFSGTYDTDSEIVLGEEGSAVPYSYRITYDTSLGSLLYHFPVGYDLGGYTTTQEWFGYNAAGMTGGELGFGTGSWNVSDINPRDPAGGISADLWFDADLNVATPTCAWIYFDAPPDLAGDQPDLQIGGGYSDSSNIYLSVGESDVDAAISMDMVITIVPEPEVTTLVGMVFCVWALACKRAKAR